MSIDTRKLAEAFQTITQASASVDEATIREFREATERRLGAIERALIVGLGDDLLWSLDDTRRRLGGVSDTYVRELADAGLIQRRYQGRRPFFVASSVRAYVESLTDDA